VKLRDGACLRIYPIVEQNGFLWAWYHPHAREPLFPLQEFSEISSGDWTDFEKYDWQIHTHVQEAGENAVDSAHFLSVHHVGEILGTTDTSFDEHRRVSALDMELSTAAKAGGRVLDEPIVGRVVTTSSGPGQTWTRQSGFADLLIIGLPTPVERDSLHLRFACSVPRSQVQARQGLSKLAIRHAVEQVGQDVPIWEHKIYRPTPLLCDGDGPIAEYREWFRQFYAD
jgi:3-ketosteroid 9alpha-monooxygenase subunit A